MATILKGAPVVAAMNERNAALCEQLKAKGITPTLAVVRVGEREDDLSYERGVMNRCGKVGVAVRQFVLPADATQEQLLQVLDDGRITDSQGRTVDFKNTILIMTSNIGSSYLLDGIEEDGTIRPESQAAVMEDLRAHFRPEFLNRLDETIMFRPLTKDNIYDIIDLLVADVNKRLADREISIFLTEDAKKYVVDGGYDPNYGARPLKRFLQKHVDTLAAKLMLQGDVGAQDTIIIDVEDGKLVARSQSVCE